MNSVCVRYEDSQLMMRKYREIIIVDSNNHTEHVNIVWGKIQISLMFSNHCASKNLEYEVMWSALKRAKSSN